MISKYFFFYRKGISGSAIPYKRTAPDWVKKTPEQIIADICNLAKKGLTPSMIGARLRDTEGVGLVKTITGNKILRILKSNGMPT